MSRTAAIATYRRFPKDLFRINNGWRIDLRPRVRPSALATSYDIAPLSAGDPGWDATSAKELRVLPRALYPRYKAPNGAMMRPNTPYTQHYFGEGFKCRGAMVYAVQQGTTLPDHLILVHESPRGEEWSLQPAKEMTLDELNARLTEFFLANATLLTRQQWRNAYPRATESRSRYPPLPDDYPLKPVE